MNERLPLASGNYRPADDPLANEWGVEVITPISREVAEALFASYNSGNVEDFDAFLDDTAADFLDDNCPAFTENIAKMRATHNQEAQQAIKAKQLALFIKAKERVLLDAGLGEVSAKTETDIARERVHTLLAMSKENDGDNFDPLVALGILTHDDQGQERFIYPSNLFPGTTNQKWQAYIAAVSRHLKVSNDTKMGTATPNDLKEADFARRAAHNAISSDIRDILNLNWELDETRNLVAKMRENRYPNISTGEKDRTNRALEEGLTVLEALRLHLGV